MAARKKKTTRSKKVVTKKNKTAPIFFICLIIAAASGWYISIAYNKETSTNNKITAKVQNANNIIPQNRPPSANNLIPSVIPQQKVVPLSAQSNLSPTEKASKLSIAPQLPIPQKKDATFPHSLSPLRKNNYADSQNSQDSAKIIFAQKRTIIYQAPNITSKQLSVVERGQELRSYAKQGNWHKITVPRAGIIGWALDNSFQP